MVNCDDDGDEDGGEEVVEEAGGDDDEVEEGDGDEDDGVDRLVQTWNRQIPPNGVQTVSVLEERQG